MAAEMHNSPAATGEAARFTSQPLADDQGSASLEFITVGMLLLVPLVYLILTLSVVQAGVFAVEGAARQAARVFVQSATVAQGTERAHNALNVALADHGLNADAATITVTCSPNPATCLTRSGFVTVTVLARVSLQLAPPVLDVNAPFAVLLSATATQQVSRLWTGR
jgi:hypothetical protein